MESTPVSRPPTAAGAATARPAAMATMLTPESEDSVTPLGGAIGGLIPGARGAATTGARNRHPSRHFTAPRGTSAPLPSHAGWLEKLRPEGHGFSLKTRKWQRRYFRLPLSSSFHFE